MRAARNEIKSSTAGRLAANRRAGRTGEVRRPTAGKKSRASSSGGGLVRALKLLVLVGAFACIGFFAVLVIDVSASLIGSVKLGDVSVGQLWDKVVARVFDEDVPRDPRKAAPAPAPGAPKIAKPSSAASRAPLPVARPEDDARHVTEPPSAASDPEVERAKRRLDELLGRL